MLLVDHDFPQGLVSFLAGELRVVVLRFLFGFGFFLVHFIGLLWVIVCLLRFNCEFGFRYIVRVMVSGLVVTLGVDDRILRCLLYLRVSIVRVVVRRSRGWDSGLFFFFALRCSPCFQYFGLFFGGLGFYLVLLIIF